MMDDVPSSSPEELFIWFCIHSIFVFPLMWMFAEEGDGVVFRSIPTRIALGLAISISTFYMYGYLSGDRFFDVTALPHMFMALPITWMVSGLVYLFERFHLGMGDPTISVTFKERTGTGEN